MPDLHLPFFLALENWPLLLEPSVPSFPCTPGAPGATPTLFLGISEETTTHLCLKTHFVVSLLFT